MRYWFDTEFIENGTTVDLISIGIVDEEGDEFYAINWDCDLDKASDWVKENVISQLPNREHPAWMKKKDIAFEIMAFIKMPEWGAGAVDELTYDSLKSLELKQKPEIWAYYADYDWVAFCQLFGTMMDLPKGFPMYCRDIKQECDRLGNPELPKQEQGEHNALDDARWNKRAWEFLREVEAENAVLSLTKQQAIALKNFISDHFHQKVDDEIALIFDQLQGKVGW